MEDTPRHILFEHVSGYELFELRSLETLAAESYSEYLALTQTVSHVSSLPFTDATEAVAMINTNTADSTELPAALASFLALNRVCNLYADRSFKNAVQAAGIKYYSSPEIMRGIRANINRFTGKSLDKQQLLSAAHLLSRETIRYDMQREDNLAINVGFECEALEAEIASLSARIANLVEWRVPQFKKIIKGENFNAKLAEMIIAENERTDSAAVKETPASLAEETTTLTSVNGSDLKSLEDLNNTIIEKKKLLAELESYLGEKLGILAPNLRAILGNKMCFKLIHKSGGLTNLAQLPASTLQLLGAEKSLFRSLKMRSRTPKYGILYNAKGLKGGDRERGRMCRFIANKCSIAARIDAFGEERDDAYGKELSKLINKKIAAGRSSIKVEQTQDLLERVHTLLEKKNQSRASNANANNAKALDAGTSKKHQGASQKEGTDNSLKSTESRNQRSTPTEAPSKRQSGDCEGKSHRSVEKQADIKKRKGVSDMTVASKSKARLRESSSKKQHK